MIRNIKWKHFLVDRVFPIFTIVNRMLPKQDKTIFIYCANDELNDNSRALFDYLIKHEYQKQYKIVCGVKKTGNYKADMQKNVYFIKPYRCVWQYMTSKYVFYSTGKIPIRPVREQCVINMWHGVPMKTIGRLSNINNGEEFFFTYVCAPSKLYSTVMAKAFGCPIENVCICGEQKTDKLFLPKRNSSGNKYIIWAPTFRKSKYLGYDDSSIEHFLPLFQNSEWNQLNAELKNKNIKMLVKLHPMQDLNGFSHKNMSHLIICSDPYFKAQKMDLYEELSQSDAVISDYSSVPLEYMMIDRPICYAFDDLEEYTQKRGFVFENPLEYMPGDKAVTKEQLFSFIKDIAEGIDRYKDIREAVNKKVNQYCDGKNCERTLQIAGIILDDNGEKQ